jgi:hypothetical protein
MKTLRSIIICSIAILLSAPMFGADPSGLWKWITPGRNGQPQECVLKLLLTKDGTLSGTLADRSGAVVISDASFRGSDIEFSVVRETPAGKIVTTYSGRITGDTITGSNARPDNAPEAVKVNKKRQADWIATRQIPKG